MHIEYNHRFLPSITRAALDDELRRAGIEATVGTTEANDDLSIVCSTNTVQIGRVRLARRTQADATMVPDPLFYDNAAHTRLLESMAVDWASGEHLLLIGNQGVGKNKLIDRLLHLLNRPRQYIQLHRCATLCVLCTRICSFVETQPCRR
jgi:midasin (ATPase involved in ribosome maturation)